MKNITLTQNGALAFGTTGNSNLDFFSIKGSMQGQEEELKKHFVEALEEDPILATCNLLHLRDIKGGLGQRDTFREALTALPEVLVEAILEAITEIGRWDDLIHLHDNPKVVGFINKQLTEDLKDLKSNKSVSLLGKWMPSINASNLETKRLGRIWAKKLGLSERSYRKALTMLRKKIKIVENNLREKDYSFEYEKLPTRARIKYTQAFMRNDRERFEEYIEALDAKTLNSKLVYPHEIVKQLKRSASDAEVAFAEKMWQGQEVSKDNGNTIVVRDGSGSMEMGYGNVLPSEVADALSILFAENIEGPFKDTFITFSSKPQIVKFPGGLSLRQKLDHLRGYWDVSNTDIEKVYKLIYDTSVKLKDLPREKQISRIVIISDMEFDIGAAQSRGQMRTVSDTFRRKFEKAGLIFPEIVYWNVNANRVNIPVSDIRGVKLVSGYSSSVIDSIINNDSLDAMDMMFKTLSPYINLIDADVVLNHTATL